MKIKTIVLNGLFASLILGNGMAQGMADRIAGVGYAVYNHPYETLEAMTVGTLTANIKDATTYSLTAACTIVQFVCHFGRPSRLYNEMKDTYQWITNKNYSLHDAVKSNKLYRVKYLIEEKGVNPYLLDEHGKTAWSYAHIEDKTTWSCVEHPEILDYACRLAAERDNYVCGICRTTIENTDKFSVGSAAYSCLHFLCRDCNNAWRINPASHGCPLCLR